MRKGEVINEQLAGVLSKLGIKAVELGISMRAVYDNGLMIVGDQLKVDVDATRKSVEQSNQEAYALAMGIGYASKDTIKPLLQMAHQKAMALSVSAAIPTKDTIGRAHPQSKRTSQQPPRKNQTKSSLKPLLILT